MIIILFFISCGKNSDGSGQGSSFTIQDDPCKKNNVCTDIIEITSATMYSRRVSGNGHSRLRNYKIGRTYETSNFEFVNSYDQQNDKIIGNCLISYDEKQTLYKVDIDYVDDYSSEPFDRQIYKRIGRIRHLFKK